MIKCKCRLYRTEVYRISISISFLYGYNDDINSICSYEERTSNQCCFQYDVATITVCIPCNIYIYIDDDDDNDQEEIYKTWKDSENKIYIIPSEYSLIVFVCSK